MTIEINVLKEIMDSIEPYARCSKKCKAVEDIQEGQMCPYVSIKLFGNERKFQACKSARLLIETLGIAIRKKDREGQ